MTPKTFAEKYIKKYDSRNPYEIADYLNIEVFNVPLGNLAGFYKYMKKHRCIFLNTDITGDNFKRFVMAHELGHALMHTKENCYFADNKTFINTSKIEIDANNFALNLLISDDMIIENKDYSTQQLSRLWGYDQKLISLRLSDVRKPLGMEINDNFKSSRRE